jgi:NADH:ubiquinone oxidoreductase subunit 5 (subunit L)/multisubunit Na+/H+ antiporter MnhA subunit
VDGWTGSLVWGGPLRLSAELTPLSAVVAMVVPAVAFCVVLYAAGHEAEAGLARLVALLLVFVGGMELLVVAADLLTLLIGWEIVGACSWALIGHRWRDLDHPGSGLYAFVATRLGDLGLFVATMAAFAGAGSFAYADLAGLGAPWLTIVAFGVVIAAAVKSGQLPLAGWLFRAMDGPTSVSALLHAATMVAAGAYLLARLEPTLAAVPGFGPAVIAVGLTTALAGGIVALLQRHAKKLLAASTSAHYGLMVVAVGAGYPGVAVLHLTAHAAFKALLFLAAGIAGERAGSYLLHDLALGRALPFTAAFAAVGALSLAGVPPLGAAWTKESVLAAAAHASPWLAAGVVLAGALSAAYALRFQLLAFGAGPAGPGGERPALRLETAGAALLTAASLALGLLWWPAVAEAVAQALAATLPARTRAELVASLALVAAGLVVGRYLAERQPMLGEAGTAARAAEWLGLPLLVRHAVILPFERFARWAARIDDDVLDALPRGVAGRTRRFATGLAGRDRRTVDRGVDLVASATAAVARLGDRVGEAVADGLPEGTARLTFAGAGDARGLQTGMAHHYYALLTLGAAALAALLLVGL